MKKAFTSILSAVVAAVITLTAMTSSAAGTYSDPNGDGKIDLTDAIYLHQGLNGAYNFDHEQRNNLDFFNDGIVSIKDKEGLQHYIIDNLSTPASDPLFDMNILEEDEPITAYWKHDCSKAVNQHTEYTLSLPYSTYSIPSPISMDAIIGDNNMEIDPDISVVSIVTDINGTGSGFIIDDHIVATAGHCVYRRKEGQFVDVTIDIYDSLNNKIGSYKPKYIHINKEYATTAGSDYDVRQYDYALLYFEEDLSQYGKFDLGIPLLSYMINSGEITVSGFPITFYYPDNYTGKDYGYRFKDTGKIRNCESEYRLMNFYADVAMGDSGGPVYVNEEFSTSDGRTLKYKTAIGICIYENVAEGYNTCVRITPKILKFYRSNPYLTN